MPPSVVAIVLNWCNESDTAACLESLAASSYARLTVLLIDNGSPDGSGDRLHARFPALPYLQTGENLGYAGGNNRGFDWALVQDAEYVLVLNNDTVVDQDCIARLVATAEERHAAAVAPQMLYYDDPKTIWYGGGRLAIGRGIGLHRQMNEPFDQSPGPASATFLCGCCMLLRADVVRTIGGFDESFFAYCEDAELSLRLLRRGYEMLYEPRARLLHRVARGAEDTPFQIRQGNRNRRRMVRKHYGLVDRLRFALWFFPTRAMHLARHVARLDWPRARAVLEGTFGSLE